MLMEMWMWTWMLMDSLVPFQFLRLLIDVVINASLVTNLLKFNSYLFIFYLNELILKMVPKILFSIQFSPQTFNWLYLYSKILIRASIWPFCRFPSPKSWLSNFNWHLTLSKRHRLTLGAKNIEKRCRVTWGGG